MGLKGVLAGLGGIFKDEPDKPSSKGRILVVDDDVIYLKLLERDLTNAGYTVIQACHGAGALAIAKLRAPSLIMLDINMPGIMDGAGTAKALQSDPATSKIPIVFLSSLVMKQEQSSRGPDGLVRIAKPYVREELLKVIEQHIRY